MPITRPHAFQLRSENGYYNVYMTRVNGREVPRGEQTSVFSDRSLAKAQPVADALNNGMLERLVRQFAAQRIRDDNAEAVRRLMSGQSKS